MKRKPFTINDEDRQQWCDNDESLYYWQRASALPRRDFIRTNRNLIDAIIRKAVGQHDTQRSKS
ncbi:MAG: hypothetical protein IPN11_14330 [Opitutaceae bacterium]|nr:hypothetical protein [Opitutaceae bacterium]